MRQEQTITTMKRSLVLLGCALFSGMSCIGQGGDDEPPLYALNYDVESRAKQQLLFVTDKGIDFGTNSAKADRFVSERDYVLSIPFIEEAEEIDLGFDPADYLPEDFDPHKVYFDLNAIEYVEFGNDELGFDTAPYLPEGFDPYTDVVPVGSVNYIKDDEIDLGFDTAKYLPKNFDPYKKKDKS